MTAAESPDTPLCGPVAAVEGASGATDPANASAATPPSIAVLIARMSAFIDGHNADKSPGHLLRMRTGKVNEELGEVEELLIELENSNPRKPTTRPADDIKDDIRRELLDVALTALGAFEHPSGNRGAAHGWLEGHVRRVAGRLGVDTR